MAQIVTITNPLTGQPVQVDQLEHTAQEIDDAIARALPSGAIDTLLQEKANITKKTTVTLSTNWTGDASPYTQTVTISGTTANSKVDLQPDATAIAQMADDGTVSLYIANDNGTLTANAVGEKPTVALTIQATITEVNA